MPPGQQVEVHKSASFVDILEVCKFTTFCDRKGYSYSLLFIEDLLVLAGGMFIVVLFIHCFHRSFIVMVTAHVMHFNFTMCTYN